MVTLDVIVYPLHAIQLCASSIDRLLVVTFPITYFIHPQRFLIIQLLLAHAIFAFISISTIAGALLFFDKKISAYCR
jgi:hypothetical protein